MEEESGAVNAAETPAPAPAAIRCLCLPGGSFNTDAVMYPVREPICTLVPSLPSERPEHKLNIPPANFTRRYVNGLSYTLLPKRSA